MKGYIHLYTGNGKGKTTAAIGLTIRAIGAKQRVFFGQFVKGMKYSEIEILNNFPQITLKQFGLQCFIENKPTNNDIQAARKGLTEISKIIEQNIYQLIILDEVCIALFYKLFEIDDVIHILQHKPQETEIVMTGRYAPPELYNIADLVTEMNEVKHYFNDGVQARKGIEY